MQRREGDVLAELERDLQAAADVAARVTRARAALQTHDPGGAATGAHSVGDTGAAGAGDRAPCDRPTRARDSPTSSTSRHRAM